MLVVLLLCVGAGAQRWDADSEYEGAAGHDHNDVDFDDYYDEEDFITSTTVTQQETRTQTMRVRRYGDRGSVARTLSEDEIKEVKGVLKELMLGRDVTEMTKTEATSAMRSVVERVTRSPAFTGLTRSSIALLTRTSQADQTKFYENIIEQIIDNARRQGADRRTDTTKPWPDTPYEGLYIEDTDKPKLGVRLRNNTDGGIEDDPNEKGYVHPDASDDSDGGDLTNTTIIRPTKSQQNTTSEVKTSTVTTSNATNKTTSDDYSTTTTTKRSRRTRRKTTTTTTPKEVIDIETLVEIIANLTLDYELINITDLFNKTLLAYNIPKCLEAPTTTTVTSTTTITTTEEPMMYDLVNATVISKCFVCGLETYGIPRNAWCADAFAGDFLPLVPVDPLAKGQIANYRKYCRYLDVPGVLQNETQPRSVYGRFTGGCSVRWVDLSGVYTQRACRNRRRAVMGKHFVSKRMAKLEMALTKEDNGCIISPMSSLVPLSRGISLYARFHACVCTGNWCNHAVTPPQLRRVAAAPAAAWILALISILVEV